jgi:hypothetical protein
MAVLTILKCLQKIGQSSSFHPATICISVLGSIPSQGLCLPRTAVIYQVASIWPFKVLTAASTVVMLLRGPTRQACSTVTHICTTADSIQELLVYQDSSITHTLCCMPAITTEPPPAGPSTSSSKTSTRTAFKC